MNRFFLLVFILLFIILFNGCEKNGDTTCDVDGNQYHSITIGTQTWMLENLKTTKYNDGTSIPNVTDKIKWGVAPYYGNTSGAYCNYNNDESHAEKYGRLYNWYAVKTGKLAPKGWHIPTDTEWRTLIDYLIANGYNYDGTTIENKIAKSLGKNTDWALSDDSGTIGSDDYAEYINKSGFNAVPGGCRDYLSFVQMGYGCYFWCIYNNNLEVPYRLDIYYNMSQIFINIGSISQGFSVRCIKDS